MIWLIFDDYEMHPIVIICLSQNKSIPLEMKALYFLFNALAGAPLSFVCRFLT